jgi:hypothetical protein
MRAHEHHSRGVERAEEDAQVLRWKSRDANILFELRLSFVLPQWTSSASSKSMTYNRPRAGSLDARPLTDAGGRQMFAGSQPLCLYHGNVTAAR